MIIVMLFQQQRKSLQLSVIFISVKGIVVDHEEIKTSSVVVMCLPSLGCLVVIIS